MRWLLFLSRIAFLYNIVFLFSVLLLWRDFLNVHAIISTIIITGYFLAVFVFNPPVNLAYLVSLLAKRFVCVFT